MDRIEEILVPDSLGTYFTSPPFNSLNGIRRLNVFVGPNNSGKSRLLRELFLTGKKLQIADESSASIRKLARKSLEMAGQLPESLRPDQKFYSLLNNNRVGFVDLATGNSVMGNFANQFSSTASQIARNWTGLTLPKDQISYYREFGACLVQLSSSIGSGSTGSRKCDFVYVPTLRGMRLDIPNEIKHRLELDSSTNMNTAYLDRTLYDYVFPNRTDSNLKQIRTEYVESIKTGLDLYNYFTRKLLGSLQDRQFVRAYEEYLSRSFYLGEPVTLVPRQDHDTLNIKIGDEVERPIQKLGDGLQHLIILTLPLFEPRASTLFYFVEEPDLFLHPGFQTAFINAVLDNPERDLYVFVTTHSQQFLDATLSEDQCAIFRCEKSLPNGEEIEKEPTFRVFNATERGSELLDYLGIKPSSVLFANCTIWVEGITDRLYLSRYLELYFRESAFELIENLHYCFVEYAGSNITHWSFLDEDGINVERLCGRLILVADSDDSEDTGKKNRHQKLKAKLGSRFELLPVREIENLLTPSVIMSVIESFEQGKITPDAFNQSDYTTAKLGDFIDSKLPDVAASKRFKPGSKAGAYAAKSGTIKDKVSFCQRALRNIKEFADLSEQAKKLTERLAEFVMMQNGLSRKRD